MEAQSYIDPQLQDLLLTDITKDLLVDIAHRFGVSYLADASTAPSYPVVGKVIGGNNRAVFNLVVSLGRRSKNVIFILDTGSPCTYLSTSPLHALGCTDVVPVSLDAEVHGHCIAVNPSPATSHFADVNVLGMNFIFEGRLKLVIDGRRRQATIEQV